MKNSLPTPINNTLPSLNYNLQTINFSLSFDQNNGKCAISKFSDKSILSLKSFAMQPTHILLETSILPYHVCRFKNRLKVQKIQTVIVNSILGCKENI